MQENFIVTGSYSNFYCNFALLFVPKSERAEGGRKAGNRHILKALTQRLICGSCELRNFQNLLHGKAMFNVHWLVYSFYVHTAWASALLILSRKALRRPTRAG